ncbi:hypothetical protein IG631_15493 [Alternaria alternata]|nr:hypothetical protein IG631_15493 [Alternaria alternata]
MPNGTAKETELPDLTPNISQALLHQIVGLGGVPTAGYGRAPSHRPFFQHPNLRHCHGTHLNRKRGSRTFVFRARCLALGTYSISQPMRGSRTDLPAYTTRTCDPHSTSKAQPRTSPNVSPLPELALSLLEYVCARLSPWSGQGVRSMLLLLSGLVEASPVASSLPFTGAATIS